MIFTLRKKEKKVGFFSYQWRDAGRDLLKTSTGKSEISAPLSPFHSLSLTSLTPSSLSPSLLSPPLVLAEASPPCSPSGLRSLLGQVFFADLLVVVHGRRRNEKMSSRQELFFYILSPPSAGELNSPSVFYSPGIGFFTSHEGEEVWVEG